MSAQHDPGGASVGGNVNAGRDFIGRDQINIYLNSGGATRDAQQLQRAIQEYLGWVQRQYSTIRLFSYHPGDRKMRPIPIEGAYVQFDAVIDETSLATLDDRVTLAQQMKNLGGKTPFAEMLKFGHHVVIAGGAGTGKSIALLQLAFKLAQGIEADTAAAADQLVLSRPLPLPIYLPLERYAQYRAVCRQRGASPGEQSLARFIAEHLRENHLGLPDDFFSTLLDADARLVLLLDGLDEVIDPNERTHIAAHIQSLASGKRTVRFVVAARPQALLGDARLDAGFLRLMPAPFTPEDVKRMVYKAYRWLYDEYPPEQDRQARRQAEALLRSIAQLEQRRREQLGAAIPPLIDSPLMTRLAIIVHSYAGSLPEQRAELFMKACEALLRADYDPDPNVTADMSGLVGDMGSTSRPTTARRLCAAH